MIAAVKTRISLSQILEGSTLSLKSLRSCIQQDPPEGKRKIKLTLSRDPPLQGMSLCRCVFVINSNVKGKSIDRNSKFNLIVVLRKTDHK